MLSRRAPEGMCPYCSNFVQAILLKGRWFYRNQYLCTHPHCKKVVYICLSLFCDNYVKSGKKSSKYCSVCSSDSGDGGDGGDEVFYSPEPREYIENRHKSSSDLESDSSSSDIGGGDAGGGGDGGGSGGD